MDGFGTEPTIEEQECLNQASKIKTLKDPPDNFDSYLSLADSFLDFDYIKEFFENIPPNPDRNCLEKIEFGVVGKSLKMSEEEKTNSRDVRESDLVSDGSGCTVKESNSSCCIEEEMGKVSLVGVKSETVNDQDVSGKVGLVTVDGNGVKSEMLKDENESESSFGSEEESSSSSSSSSTSSSDEEEEEDAEEEKEVKMEVRGELNVAGELEEGEIEGVDGEETVGRADDDDDEDDDEMEEGEVEMVGGSDAEFDFIGDEDEDGDGGGAAGGPIKSKNELQVLPPVPQVDVTLQPEHQMLPVGVVLSVLGAQVIVEGVEKHNPLNEGSILWITESRSPLGLIDEIFGPVKSPYYVVRYDSDREIPAGIHVGTSISFVQEFANHVLNDKNLCKKGYDASGENDEEISEEAEFSDDEKEAEHKRKLKMEKRGMNDQKPNRKNNRKKVRNRDGTLQNGRQTVQQIHGAGRLPQNQVQHQVSSVPADHGNCSSPSAVGQGFIGGIGLVRQFQPMAQTAGFGASFNGVWTNGMLSQQPQSAVFPSGFQSNGMPWLPQNYQQHPNQMPMMNSMPFLQQFDPSQRSLPNAALPGGQPTFFAGSTYAPWLGFVGQNGLNQMMGMGLPGQHVQPSINGGQPGLNQTVGMGFQGQPPPQSTNAGECVDQQNFQPAEVPKQVNMGASSSRGRKPYHRGGGRYAGGRGRGHSK